LEKSAELAMDIMKMKLNARRLPRIWKKVVMLPQLISLDKEKLKPENWRLIALINSMLE
jgi:hypothetical protein